MDMYDLNLSLITIFSILYQATIWLPCYTIYVNMGRWKRAFAIYKGKY
jgi:hypothetical protein